ncbi:MAG: heavy-metal-associated domain-containing protein [Candidatus Peribacteraceae bacterium]|nr:heavy-metal-associated domain-containing protein [Candidatus Peribacteraceae bacterium]MDD5742169.1 heavy-metal-associated domain-containing protein [Candidatus Peribacteraceae bacterium]
MRTLVSIPAIHCQSCVALITDVSQDFPSIQNINVDVPSKTITLEHDGHFDLHTWSTAVEDLNAQYKVQPLSQTL